MRLDIQYFALLREQRGLDRESLETESSTPIALYAELSRKNGFTLPNSALKVAINDEFATWDTPLKPGDTVVFIPPVAGG